MTVFGFTCVFDRLKPLDAGDTKAKIIPLHNVIPKGHATDNYNIHLISSRFSSLTFKFDEVIMMI